MARVVVGVASNQVVCVDQMTRVEWKMGESMRLIYAMPSVLKRYKY